MSSRTYENMCRAAATSHSTSLRGTEASKCSNTTPPGARRNLSKFHDNAGTLTSESSLENRTPVEELHWCRGVGLTATTSNAAPMVPRINPLAKSLS